MFKLLSEDQVEQIKRRWQNLRYARVDLRRQLGGDANGPPTTAQAPSVNAHPHYLLTQRSLARL